MKLRRVFHVYLDEEEYERLRTLAGARRVTVAALLREGIELVLGSDTVALSPTERPPPAAPRE